MTTLHPQPFRVFNLRLHRRQRTLAVMLALAGSVACGENDATGPRSPDLAAPGKQWTVPTTASLITQWEADATRAEVENSRRGVNSLAYETYAGVPDIASRDQWFAAPADASVPPPPTYFPPPSGCTGSMNTGTGTVGINMVACTVAMSGYVSPPRIVGGKATGKQPKSATKPGFIYTNEGEDPCAFYRYEIRRIRTEYTYAYAEFWENLTINFWRAPLNWMVGGPRDVMRQKYQQMYFVVLAAKSHGCTRAPRDSYTTPG